MSKIIKYGFEAKQAIKAGVDKAANAINLAGARTLTGVLTLHNVSELPVSLGPCFRGRAG